MDINVSNGYGIEVEWTEEVFGNKRCEDELVEDTPTPSNRLYGKRLAEMKKQRKLEKIVVVRDIPVPVQQEVGG